MGLNENFEAKASVSVPEQSPQRVESRETGPEAESAVRSERVQEAAPEEAVPVSAPAVRLPSAPAGPVKDAYHQRLERVLEDGLTDLYLAMPKDRRQAFRAEGERVASRLRLMIDSAKIRASEVLKLITLWLKMIPGVNRWFLEQEAKIKTDHVIRLAEERRREGEGL